MISKDYRKTALEHYKNHICVICGYGKPEVLEVAHVKQKPRNNNASNLVLLCPTHHREYDVGLIPKSIILAMRKKAEEIPQPNWNKLTGMSQQKRKENAKKASRTRKDNLKKLKK